MTARMRRYTTLIDVRHSVSTAFQFINVPMGIWIDEKGRVVRPAEPAWNTDQVMKIAGGKEYRHPRRRFIPTRSEIG